MSKEENLKIIYEEVSEIHRFQQSGVDMLNNKMNWVLVSDLVFLAVVYDLHQRSVLAVLLASLSAIVVLIYFKPIRFKSTVEISKQLEHADKDSFLRDLIDTKRQAFNANAGRVKELKAAMLSARVLLIAALAVQVLALLPLCVLYGR